MCCHGFRGILLYTKRCIDSMGSLPTTHMVFDSAINCILIPNSVVMVFMKLWLSKGASIESTH